MFFEKSEVFVSSFVCWSVLIVELWRWCYRWLGIPPLNQRHYLIWMCFSSYFKQWPSDLPMESNSYVICFTNTRKYFFFSKINAYLNILNQIHISLSSSNKFSSTVGILCGFSLIFKYQEKCLFRLSICPKKTN